MKKHLLLLLVACLMFAGSIFAQQHLSFKGVPINGTLKEYTDAMVKAGFYYELTQDGIAVLKGDFAGYKNCIVGVYTLQNFDIVSGIVVLFPDNDTWSALIRDYEHLKEMLTEKYGRSTDSEERFTGYTGSSDDSKLYALRHGEYKWYTIFTTELGTIELSLIEGTEYNTGKVQLVYRDKINTEKLRSAAMDDL